MAESQLKKPQPNKPQQVRTRLVLNFPGFEQTDSEAQLGRLLHGTKLTGDVWGFKTKQKITPPKPATHHTIADHQTQGANWKTQTRLVQFRWNDIVEAYERAPFPTGFLKDTRKYLAFFLDGTIVKYLKTGPRYFGFTIFPILLALIFAALVWNLIGLVTSIWLIKFVITLIGTLIMCKWPGKFLYVPLTIADWGFARDMANRENQEVEARFSEFGKTALSEIKKSNHDEIIIVGHSFGAIWAVVALARAIEPDASAFKNKKITFLALGSSLLKVSLTQNAKFLRENWNLVTAQENIFWHEIQTKDDWISFYKCDPFELEDYSAPKGGYQIDRIKFKDGMEQSRYKKMRKSFYRTHRQYILSYDKRVHFDYMLRLFGPFSAKSLAIDQKQVGKIDTNGKLA